MSSLDSGRCVIATDLPTGLTAFPRTSFCGQLFIGGERHGSISNRRSTTLQGNEAVIIGGREVRRQNCESCSPPGGTHVSYLQDDVVIDVSMWGMTAPEMDQIVRGIKVVSPDEWEAATPNVSRAAR
jgi:hypothetical protein